MPQADPSSESLLQFLKVFGEANYSVAFIFGGGVIALYAGKRLGELISPPKDEAFDFTKMLSLSTMVGRDVYYRSYIFYLFLLEFFYLIICAVEPLGKILLGQSNTVTFQGPTWPLTAALLVVGLLPTVPIVAQIEQSLRRFAHNMASIPDEYYNRVTALSTQDIERLASQSSEYDEEVEFFWRVTNILSILGFDYDDATRKARKCTSLRLFGKWTLDDKELWSQSEYEKYRDVIELLRPRYDALKTQLSQFIAETEASDFVKGVIGRNNDINIAAKIDLAQASRLRRDADRILNGTTASSTYAIPAAELDTFKHLREEWSKVTKECEVAAKRLIALFAIIARNDKRTLRELERPLDSRILIGDGVISSDKRFADPVLRAFAKLIKSTAPTSEPWYNSIVLSSLVMFAVASLILAGYRICTENRLFLEFLGKTPAADLTMGSVVRTSFMKAILDSFFITLACWLASVIALFIRSVKIKNEEWLTFYDFKTIPISSYASLFLYSSFAAFPALLLQYVGYYKISGKETGSVNMIEVMATNIGVSLSFGLYAIGLCILTDIVSINRIRKEPSLLFVLSSPAIAFNTIVLIVSPGYLDHPFYLINQAMLFAIVTLGGLLVYSRGLHSRIKMLDHSRTVGEQIGSVGSSGVTETEHAVSANPG